MYDIRKLADIKYPDSLPFPLLRGKKAVIGPITFEAISLIEDKFGSMEGMRDALVAINVKKSDILSIVYMLLENKDDFEDYAEFSKYAPVAGIERLMQIVFHFMHTSMPNVDSEQIESSDTIDGDNEEKKPVG